MSTVKTQIIDRLNSFCIAYDLPVDQPGSTGFKMLPGNNALRCFIRSRNGNFMIGEYYLHDNKWALEKGLNNHGLTIKGISEVDTDTVIGLDVSLGHLQF